MTLDEEAGAEALRNQMFLIGKTEAEAKAILAKQELSYRIVMRDGEYYIVTADFNPKRINLSIVDGIVTCATLG